MGYDKLKTFSGDTFLQVETLTVNFKLRTNCKIEQSLQIHRNQFHFVLCTKKTPNICILFLVLATNPHQGSFGPHFAVALCIDNLNISYRFHRQQGKYLEFILQSELTVFSTNNGLLIMVISVRDKVCKNVPLVNTMLCKYYERHNNLY